MDTPTNPTAPAISTIATIPLKAGVSSSEFWLVIVSGLLLTAQSALGLMDVAWAMGGVTLLGLVYTSIRGRLKTIHAQSAADALKGQINTQAEVQRNIGPETLN